MAKVSMSVDLDANPDNVWEMIGGFNALPDWHPAVEKSDIEGDASGKGSVRTLHLAGGGTIREQLEQLDQEGRLYSYSILSSPLPVMNYKSTIRLEPNDKGGCTVHWDSDFQAAGAPEGDAVKAIQGVYQAGFDNLKKMFGG